MKSRSFELGEFGKLCKDGRAALLMTRPEMAKNLDHTMVQITAIESGRVKPSEHYIARVTGMLGLSTKDVRAALQKDNEMRTSTGENVIPFGR
ncbi:hypothetical protein [Rhizobium leguminosarum]|jgi:DNA-binding XRE family transcriptional regulator|uniref:hypothetical protein n=1 Tax=Rhizobium leguminosarum TaxID=384 RepID=UPI00102F6A0F|nr:hypothetical protein [Rhizobium leguminosarum]TAY98408.1 hypothetical protein ELH79_07915 [Rhizobium leguminosarum]TAZ09173.1 hypothetical protein ELH78_07915 [Rhizobium leguminosarum]